MSDTSTDINFQSVVDFLKEIQVVGPEILENAEDIANKMEELFGWLFEGDRLSDMKVSVVDLFSEIANQPEFISTDALAQMVDDLNEKIAEALGIDSLPDFDLDLSEMLQEIKNMLPNDLAGIDTSDFKVLKDRIVSIIDKVSETGISFRATKDNPALTAEKGNAVGAPSQSVKTPVEERSTSAQQTPPPDGEFDTILKDFFTTNINLTESLDLLVVDIEQAIANSGIMLELEDQILVVKDNLIKTKPLTLEAVFSEFANLVNVLGKIALSLLEEILGIIITSFKGIYDEVQKIIPSIITPITNLVNMLNLGQIQNPGIYTIPSILVSIPITLGFKIVKTDVPGFPDDPKFPQDAYRVDQHPKFYGSNQFADGFASFVTGVFEVFFSEKNPNIGFWVGLADKIWGITTGVLAQNFSVPDYYISDKDVNTKDFPTRIWEYQWFQGVAWPFVLGILYCYREKKITSEKTKNSLEFVESLSVLAFEIAHLILFSIQFERERIKDGGVTSRDKRLGVASVIDPLPNIIGSISNMINLGFDRFNNPVIQGETITSSFDKIKSKVNTTGKNSIGNELTDQRAKLVSPGGELRMAFEAANNHFVNNAAGEIVFEVNRARQLLIQNNPGSLIDGLNNLNIDLNISTIGNNTQDFNTIQAKFDTFQQPIGDCQNKIDEINFMIPNLDQAWSNVLVFLDSSSEKVKSVERKIKSFKKDLREANKFVDNSNINLANFHPNTQYLTPIQSTLDPTSRLRKTIGITLQTTRTELGAFQASLLQKLIDFENLLNQIRIESEQGIAMDTLLDDINPQKIDGLIGSEIENVITRLDSLKNEVTSMTSDAKTDKTIISNRIANITTNKEHLKTALENLQPSLATIINTNINRLATAAQAVANTVNQDANGGNYSAYGEFLRDSDLNLNHGVNKFKSDLLNFLEEVIEETKKKLDLIINSFEDEVLENVKATDAKLASAITTLKGFPELTVEFGIPQSATDARKLIEVNVQVNKILVSLKKAKEKLKLGTLNKAGKEAKNAVIRITNSVQNGSPFMNIIDSVSTDLSSGGGVGQKLEEIHNILDFSQTIKNELKRPQDLINVMTEKITEIKDSIKTNSKPLKGELSKIDKGFENIIKIGNRKESRKKVKDTTFFTIVPISLTVLLKSAYGGLNWWVGDYPPPKFGKEKGTAAEKNKVFEVVSQSQENITLQVNIFNDFEGPKDVENFDNFDIYTLAWEKEVSEKWESLEDLNLDSNKKTITIDRKDLEYSIRVRLNYTHGFVIAEYKYPGPKAIKIILTNKQEASSTFELAADDNITNHVFGSLSAEDKDAITFTLDPDTDFQVNNANEISLKKPITDGTSLSVTATDAAGNINQKTFTININPAPSNIQLAITKDQNATDTFEIAEVNNNKDYVLGTLSADDSDPVTFGVTQGEKFVIDSNTNKLSLRAPIDDSEELEITASDGKSTTSKSYTININKAPTNIEIDLAGGVVSIPEPTTAPNTIEITPEGNINGQVIGTLTAEDEEGDELTFSVDKTDDFAIINNNDIVELKLNRPIEDGIELVITASDTAGNFTEKTFVFEIL